MTGVHIPYGMYWSTFARWQGSLSRLHGLRLAAWTAARELARRGIDPAGLDAAVLGYSVPQQARLTACPVAGMMGAPIWPARWSRRCATSVRHGHGGRRHHAGPGLDRAGADGRPGLQRAAALPSPDPAGPGGSGVHENRVLDNLSKDPWSGLAMLQTGERVARRHGTPRPNRTPSRRAATSNTRRLADERAFQRRYMTLPFELPRCRLR